MHGAGGERKGQEGTTTCGLEIQSCNEWNAQGRGAVEDGEVGEVVVADQSSCTLGRSGKNGLERRVERGQCTSRRTTPPWAFLVTRSPFIPSLFSLGCKARLQ